MHSKNIIIFFIATLMAIFTGCSTVPLEPKEVAQQAKSFSTPPKDKSGIYVYRDSVFGGALKKDIWIDNKCLGESAPDVFFYKVVDANKEHTISTESEFSPNSIALKTEGGKNYFVRQYIKMGAFVGGADLETIDDDEAKKAIKDLDMAKQGTCSKPSPK